jgi:hypothetical protein
MSETLEEARPEWKEGEPRGPYKSAETIESKRDAWGPLRKRVRNRMKLLSLQGCNRKQRTYEVSSRNTKDYITELAQRQ